MLMDYEAVASFMRVQIAYGKPIILDNTYRTFAQQQAGYEKNPGVFGKPGTSLHERGLALDIKTTNPNLNDSKLVDAFTKEGWVRRGKVINGKPEPWHWTYKVPG
jgi:LAS superfamily LD-carboxypeptidase LdcB